MYSREKQFRQEDHKPKKSHRNTPSFSSSLLDEICRSIDEKPKKPEPKAPETARFSRASLVEKWMENEKSVFRRRPKCVFPDNTSTSTSTSTSSDNSSSAGPTASDAELLAKRPKSVRTRQRDSYLFEEYEEHERNRATAGNDYPMIKSKSRALRLYSGLKKMKQPISPGARLTSFINSIFSGLNRKRPKEFKETDRINHRAAAPPTARCSTKSTDKMERTPRLVGDRDDVTMPRGQRSAVDGRPPLPPNAFRNMRKCDLGKVRCGRDGNIEDDDEDACSESSSDLFELDHLSLFGIKDRFSEELPVYETTYFDRNCRLMKD